MTFYWFRQLLSAALPYLHDHKEMLRRHNSHLYEFKASDNLKQKRLMHLLLGFKKVDELKMEKGARWSVMCAYTQQRFVGKCIEKFLRDSISFDLIQK